MQRAARNIENKLQGIRSEDWVLSARRRKWRFAGKVARCTDGRCSKRLLLWKPRGFRNRGRPCTRWEADIASVAGGGWIDVVADEEFWFGRGALRHSWSSSRKIGLLTECSLTRGDARAEHLAQSCLTSLHFTSRYPIERFMHETLVCHKESWTVMGKHRK